MGADGATHAGAFDLAYLCCLPGFIIMAAADEAELVHMIATARDINDALLQLDTLEVRCGVELQTMVRLCR